ncbi:MAG: aminoacetone oxidase family FAD-binding enzyme, partial [Planctomycetes bacterium]|nr:aminoacetone oxidase family FAD-binding enzyme [Planctomycetota bacterium]
LLPVLLRLAEIDPEKKAAQFGKSDRKKLCRLLKDLRLTLLRPRPIEEAIVTAGGVCLDEVDPKTMQSRLVKGLYFAGEVLDVDGPTGGFNLQAAFSTGYLAGESV